MRFRTSTAMASTRCTRLCLVTLLIAIVVIVNVHGKKIPWVNIRTAQKQGPNVCVVETVPNTNHIIHTECKYWQHRKICGQKALIRYECCEGFKQVPGEKGCTGVKPLRSLVETAKLAGAKRFAKFLEESGLAKELASTEQTYTLFAPSDDCFKEVSRDLQKQLLNSKGNSRSPVLLYHIVLGRLESKHFTADKVVDTLNVGHTVRINKYSSGIETVNCAVIRRRDQQATNGVVHIIGSYLDPSYSAKEDLATVLHQDGRFTEMVMAFSKAGLARKIGSNHQSYTVFTPNDEAFQKLSRPRLERVMNDRGAREALLFNHIVPHPICLSAIINEHEVRTVGNHKLQLNCDVNGVIINGVYRISKTEVSVNGGNGLAYPIDDVIVPDRASSLVQLMEAKNLEIFLELVRHGGVEDLFENFANYTVFAPNDEALLSLSNYTLNELRTSRPKARKFVLFHATKGRYMTNQFADNQVLMSADDSHSLRLQVYRKSFGVENAIVVSPDIDGLNGCLHIIDKVMFVTDSSAGDILRQKGEFSLFLRAMEKVMESNPGALNLEQADRSFTFFAPPDSAWEEIGSTRLERMMNDIPYLTKTVKNHVVENMMCAGSFKEDLVYEVRTRQNAVDVCRKNGKVRVNDATMTSRDIVNTNGVIHVINRVLLPDQDVVAIPYMSENGRVHGNNH